MNNHENQPGPMKKQKRHKRRVTTDLGGGRGRNKQKRYLRGVTTDLLDVLIMHCSDTFTQVSFKS